MKARKFPRGDRQPEQPCKLPRGDRPPYPLDAFSGENAPVAYALAWCGWRVEPIDWLLAAPHDLSKLEVQQALATLVDSRDAAIWAVDCSTLSRAREVAIPGHEGGPRPLRAENAVRGLQSLAGRDAIRVEQANLFIDFTFAQVARSVATGKAAILESPARSHLWGFQQLKDIRKMPEWRRTLYDACCWGGARRRQQALESNAGDGAVVTADAVKAFAEPSRQRGRRDGVPTSDAGEHGSVRQAPQRSTGWARCCTRNHRRTGQGARVTVRRRARQRGSKRRARVGSHDRRHGV